jgi:hypothetical protein
VLPNPNAVIETGSPVFVIAPNPASASITISGVADPDARFEIVNAMGRVIRNVSPGENAIADLPNGLYFLRMIGSPETGVAPLIIAH